MITNEAEARAYVSELGGGLAVEKIDKLAANLASESVRQNLIARSTQQSIWLRHFADSAQLLEHVPHETGTWLDLGSGAGFPGLVIATLRPAMPMILVESRNKRIDWLSSQIAELDLPNCSVLGNRLERIEPFAASVISARAFAPLQKLFGLAGRFSTASTRWVLPKGRSAAQEVQELPKPLNEMFHVEQSMTNLEAGIVVGMGRVQFPELSK